MAYSFSEPTVAAKFGDGGKSSSYKFHDSRKQDVTVAKGRPTAKPAARVRAKAKARVNGFTG